MSVVGFDIGSQSSYIAVARHGGVEMVNNEYSDRASPTMVGLGEKQRTMGTSARSQLVMNPRSTVWSFKQLIGRKFSDPFVQRQKDKLPYQIIKHGKDDIGIKVSYGNEPAIFSPEQVMAMLLTYLKKVTEASLSKPVSDCVIAVPSFFTDAQRRAMLESSAIAGLTCLRLMNDTTATALAYGIYKQDLPEEPEKPRNVVFIDMGHSSLQVAICAFQKGKLKVLSKAFDYCLGGKDFTDRLVTHFKQEFRTQYKLDSLDKLRPTLRLFNECEKLKKNLSANTTYIPLNIDCLTEDKDVSGKTNRTEFNELCADLLQRVRAPLEDALAKSKLKIEDIDSVELVGGSSRIPAIKETIIDVFKKELSTTLNMDEAVARGCALQCAMLSPTFKVRDFSVADIQPYPIRLSWDTFIEGESGEMVVFKEGDTIYHSKVLTFYRRKPFDLVANYQFPQSIPYPDPYIGSFSVRDVKPTEDGDAGKVKVKVRLSIHGVFFVKTATMVEKVVTAEPPSMEVMETEGAGSGGSSAPANQASGNDGDNSQGSEEQKVGNDQPMEGADETDGVETVQPAPPSDQPQNETETTTHQETTPTPNQEGGAETPKKAEEKAKVPEAKKPKKPTVKYVDLPIEEKTASHTKKQIDDLREKEVNMAYQDELEQQKVDAKNAVEEYVYTMRDKLSDSLVEFVTEPEKEQFLKELSATEDWLYDEGEEQPKKVYVKRLEQLQKTGNKIVEREREFIERPSVFEELAHCLVHYEKILTLYKDESDDTYKHIDGTEMEKVATMVAEKRAWYNTQLHACELLAKHATPPVRAAEIKAVKSNMETSCNPIVTKPKPKPKVEPPKDDKGTEGETAKEEKEGDGVNEGREGAGGEEGGEKKDPQAQETEEKMEADPSPPKDGEDMDLD